MKKEYEIVIEIMNASAGLKCTWKKLSLKIQMIL